jgi:hypothetical protein
LGDGQYLFRAFFRPNKKTTFSALFGEGVFVLAFIACNFLGSKIKLYLQDHVYNIVFVSFDFVIFQKEVDLNHQ